jgi:hypothetical protein
MIRLEITTSGAAFDGAPASEVARVLDMLARRIRADLIVPGDDRPIYDINGARCGAIEWTLDDDD